MRRTEFPTPLEALLADPRIILIVEDEDIVRRTLTRVLGDAGYRTLEAREGAEGLRMVSFAYPYLHLVITDILMPELDGRALGQRVQERWPELPVLYISGYPADDLFHRGAPTSLAPFLQKPIVAEDLLRSVERLLHVRPAIPLTPDIRPGEVLHGPP